MDNKLKRGKPDRIRVAKGEDYEVAYVARKFRVSKGAVRAAIKSVGYMRKNVYAELRALVARTKRRARAKSKRHDRNFARLT